MHGHEYRARTDVLQPPAQTTLGELRRQVRQLKADKGFDVTLEQRLVYLTSEVGEVAREVLKLSRDGNADVGTMEASEVRAVKENLGMEIYDVLWNLVDLAGVDLDEAFVKKAGPYAAREW